MDSFTMMHSSCVLQCVLPSLKTVCQRSSRTSMPIRTPRNLPGHRPHPQSSPPIHQHPIPWPIHIQRLSLHGPARFHSARQTHPQCNARKAKESNPACQLMYTDWPQYQFVPPFFAPQTASKSSTAQNQRRLVAVHGPPHQLSLLLTR
ncbi:hypothetical protein CsSME_00004071 [Camellia sinensis var. sinensis]